MEKKYWILRETHKKWNLKEFKHLSANIKSYEFFYSCEGIDFNFGDIFIGLNREMNLIITVGVCISNSYSLPRKNLVYVQPRYFFRSKTKFSNISSYLDNIEEVKAQLLEHNLFCVGHIIWEDIMSEIRQKDSYGFKIADNLKNFSEQQLYLNNILNVLEQNECDYNERQEIFLLLRNLLNWNAEFSNGRVELEELLAFLKYSLHIEDLAFEKREKILDIVITNWIKYSNLLTKRQIRDLQDIKVPFLL